MKIRPSLLALVLPLAWAASAGLALADPPPWAPAHGYRAQHHYVYYPHGEIYYAPERRLWFWLSGNGWQAGVRLPMALRSYVRVGGIDIELDADRPYRRHVEVEREYGGRRVRWERREYRDHRGDRRDREDRGDRGDREHDHEHEHEHGDDGGD